ncbi:MAG: hypothetical protein Q9224_003462, partial [Gallowayella concinna]
SMEHMGRRYVPGAVGPHRRSAAPISLSQPEPAHANLDPAHWSESELRIWLERRGLLPSGKASREELLQRVYANVKPPKK